MIFIGAYWQARAESRDASSERIHEFLRAISPFPSLGSWFLKADSKKAALASPIDLNGHFIAKHLRSARNDFGGEMPEVGFSIGLWNGEAISFRATLGAFSPYLMNSVLLHFGSEFDEPDRPLLKGALKAAINAFDPDHAVVSSNAILDAAREGAKPWEGALISYERGGSIIEHTQSSVSK